MSDIVTQPSIRWAGIIWGALLALAAGTGILLLAVPDPEAVAGWIKPLLFELRPEWSGAVIPLIVGLLVIVLGVVWAVRRGRRAAAADVGVGAGDSEAPRA